jgi:recombination protein RecT
MANIQELKTGQAALSPKAAAKNQIKDLIEKNKGEMMKLVPRHLNPERMLKTAQQAATTTPTLLECYVPTFIGAVIQLSQLGLEPNTILGHAYLLPFNNRKAGRKDVQVIIGYKGLIELARRSGMVTSFAAHAVYERDTFEFEYGLTEKLRHIPAFGDRGVITHFYAVAHLKDGGHAFEVMTADDVRAIRAKTQGRNNSVWDEHFEQMGRKTVVRRLAKYLPLSIEFSTAVALDDRAEGGESQGLESVLDGDYSVMTDEAQKIEMAEEEQSTVTSEDDPFAEENTGISNNGQLD